MSLSPDHYNTLVFDIGDVLCFYALQKSPHPGKIPAKILKRVISSTMWEDYEKGLIDEKTCYERVSSAFQIDTEDLRTALDEARETLVFRPEMISLLRELKLQGNFQLYAMSNISLPDFHFLATKFDFSIFDRVYTSYAMHERKPDLAFYRRVLAEISGDPEKMIFIDDKPENVLTAKSFGMHAIVFKDPESLWRQLLNLLGNPVHRAKGYLEKNAGQLNTITSTGVTFMENFSQLLIYELTGNRKLVKLVENQRIWNFFQGKGILTDINYPDDLDTTLLALTVMGTPEDVVKSVMKEMVKYQNADGIILTYFDNTRPHFDPVVCVNVLNLFYLNGQGHQLSQTLDWVYHVLRTHAYVNGTRYYASAEIKVYDMFVPLLKERIQELIGSKGDSSAYAICILVCHYLGIYDHRDFSELLHLQCEDGSWETGWLYKYGKTTTLIGNCGLTTALAMKAVEEYKQCFSKLVSPVPSSFFHSSPFDTLSRHIQRRSSTKLSDSNP
ncbi:HAD-like protein [Dendrothele bispora CBS 962.96]|uniref:HAD-like protein n=1 Tax=Dendrothele bispora (strain CBS 962.96) TaxID=1314807 RepID=A0A4S8L611_DENBC|nr:HAD-like protein [Dendrothele bispora CBS 962.96]